MVDNILTRFGTGAGLDTAQLVTDLVAAERASADALLTARQTRLDARISADAQLRAAISAFSAAIDSIVASGQLQPQPRSSDAAAIAVTAIGQTPRTADTMLDVMQLAASQRIAITGWTDAEAMTGLTLAVRYGTLTQDGAGQITGFAEQPGSNIMRIDLATTDGTVAGVAQAINSAGIGLQARVVAASDGPRLVVSGPTGASNGFTLALDGGDGLAPDSPLHALAFGPDSPNGAMLTASAADARFSLDGIALSRATNRIDDAVDGLRLELKQVTAGVGVTISADYDAGAITTLVGNYVAAHNEMMGLATSLGQGAGEGREAGALNGDPRLRRVQQQLAGITARPLAGGTGARTLSEIGVRTNRDGTLALDSARLQQVVASQPERIASMFSGMADFDRPGLSVLGDSSRMPAGTYRLTGLAPATRGSLAGNAVADPALDPIVIDSSNAMFQLSVDRALPVPVVLAAGSYASKGAFVDALTDAMRQALGAAAPTVRWDDGSLFLEAQTAGSSGQLALSGMAPDLSVRLGLDGAPFTAGLNAAGLVNGVAARGIGNRLVALSPSPLSGLVVALAPDLGATEAELSLTPGIAGSLRALADQFGRAVPTSYASEQSRLTRTRSQIEARASQMQTLLTRQFAAMDQRVGAIKATQAYLEQQIAIWSSKND